jgi:hypothetical protein
MPDYIKKKDESPVEKKTTPSWKEKEKSSFSTKKMEKKGNRFKKQFL